jgi:hypothetical protein
MRSLLVALLVVLAVLLVASDPTGRPSEAAQATPPPRATPQPQATPQAQATAPRGAGRAGLSPTLVGDINNDGLVDIRDYGLWRQAFGATDCGNVADLNTDCIVDIRDYGTWRLNFGQTALTPTATPSVTPTGTASPRPTLAGRVYIANFVSNNVTVINTNSLNALVLQRHEFS